MTVFISACLSFSNAVWASWVHRKVVPLQVSLDNGSAIVASVTDCFIMRNFFYLLFAVLWLPTPSPRRLRSSGVPTSSCQLHSYVLCPAQRIFRTNLLWLGQWVVERESRDETRIRAGYSSSATRVCHQRRSDFGDGNYSSVGSFSLIRIIYGNGTYWTC